jgi:hypothetical protein
VGRRGADTDLHLHLGLESAVLLDGIPDRFSIASYNLPDRGVTIGQNYIADLTQFLQYHWRPPRPTIQLFKNIA